MTKIYKCGPLGPTVGQKDVDEQMWLANKYKNALVEIELARRAKLRAVYAGLPEDKVPTLKDLATMKRIKRLAGKRRRAARHIASREWGLYSGTYLLVEAEVDAAASPKKKAPFKPKKPREPVTVYGITFVPKPGDPRFHSYQMEGRVGAQIQGGLDTSALSVGDTHLRIEPVADDGRPISRRHDPKEGIGRTCAHLRIRSDEKGRPVWASFPLFLHRPLPKGRITWVWVQRERIGTTYRWGLCLTIDEAPVSRKDVPLADKLARHQGVIGINLGWRRFEDGLRMAYWADDAGDHEALMMPQAMYEKALHADSIEGIRKRAFNQALPAVSKILKPVRKLANAPEGFFDRTKAIHQWESPDRLYHLACWWATRRFAGDEAAFALVSNWAWGEHGDKHLHNWTDHESDHMLAARADLIQKWAVEVARKYAVVVIDNMDIRELIEKRKDSPISENASGRRHLVAPGQLRRITGEACKKHGARFLEVPCDWKTTACHVCGEVEEWDAARELVHTCCNGHTWDQDYNHAMNLLASGKALGATTPPEVPETKGLSKRQERFRKGRSKHAVQDGETTA